MRVRKIIRRTIWTIVALATLIALFYAEEDWRGARAWQAVLQQMRDAGESMTLRELIPPGPPTGDLSKTRMFDNENPKIAEIYLPRNGEAAPPPLSSIVPPREIDLDAWQSYLRGRPGFPSPPQPGRPADDILQALKKFGPLLAELDSDLKIPGAFLPVNDGPVFQLFIKPVSGEINATRVIQLRGATCLAAGRHEAARDDFIFILRLAQPSRHRGFLIDLLVNIADEWSSLPILREGILRHAWDDNDLQAMENALRPHDFINDFQHSLRAERLLMFQEFAALNAGKFGRNYIWPSGWFAQRFVTLGEGYSICLGGIHPKEGTIDKASFEPLQGKHFSFVIFFLQGVDDVIQHAAQKTAQAESYRRMACVACELERYYLVHHTYPDQLSALTDLPPVLGREVLNQQPFHYRNLGATYQLYSTGWNETDEGGRLAFKKSDSSTPQVDETRGDWPWPGP